MIVLALSEWLPGRYAATPSIPLGSSIELDVGTFDEGVYQELPTSGEGEFRSEIVSAVWSPPEPTLVVVTDFVNLDEYEVLIDDTHRQRRLVAAIEIVSPSNSNNNRPESRRAFVAKRAGLLHDHASVTIVDLVTTRNANLYGELLEFLGQPVPSLTHHQPPLYAATCRWINRSDAGQVETWVHALTPGQTRRELPLWIAVNRATPL